MPKLDFFLGGGEVVVVFLFIIERRLLFFQLINISPRNKSCHFLLKYIEIHHLFYLCDVNFWCCKYLKLKILITELLNSFWPHPRYNYEKKVSKSYEADFYYCLQNCNRYEIDGI